MKRIIVLSFAAIACAALANAAQPPKYHLTFNGDWTYEGANKPPLSDVTLGPNPQWIASRGGGKGAVKIGKESCSPELPDATLFEGTNDWSFVVVARGVDEPGAMILGLGSMRGKGTHCVSLAATGNGGVKLVSWWGHEPDHWTHLMADVPDFDEQFHTYAVVRHDKFLRLWVDGKIYRESLDDADTWGIGWEARLGTVAWGSENPGGLVFGEGVEVDELMLYDRQLSGEEVKKIAAARPAFPAFKKNHKPKTGHNFIETNKVFKMSRDIPNRLIIGDGGERMVAAKGIWANCSYAGKKHIELRKGGRLALGAAGLTFDSGYFRGQTNEVLLAGGAIGTLAPTFIRSQTPLHVTGRVVLAAKHKLRILGGFRGDGVLKKTGKGELVIRDPSDDMQGTLDVAEPCTVTLGFAAVWPGTIKLCKGATLKLPVRTMVGNIEAAKGAKVEEYGTAHGDFSPNAFPQPGTAYDMRKIKMEKLGRGVFAFRSNTNEVWIGWRYKSSDPTNVAFNVYRDGVKINSTPVENVTYFVDDKPWSGKDRQYEVKSVWKGKEYINKQGAKWLLKGTSQIGYFDIELGPKPPKSHRWHFPDEPDDHAPTDATVADLDGDGEYELVVVWMPMSGINNAWLGETGDTWVDAVKLDGTNRRLWRICLSQNIHGCMHGVPITAYDFDGDGKAEVVCRLGDGAKDGLGRILKDGTWSFNNLETFTEKEDWGMTFAQNYVGIFNGETGEAMDTLPWHPAVLSDPEAIKRKDVGAICHEWSARNPNHQAFKFFTAIAWLDGVHPSFVTCRGMYSKTCIAAYDWDGKKLKERWYFDSTKLKNCGYGFQGFHNMRVGDVDFDGKDEIVYGHMVVDHDGKGLWTSGWGHGDAQHLFQSAPDQKGLKMWTCHEHPPFGTSLLDALNGRTMLHRWGPNDTGACNALDVDPLEPGVELFSGAHCGIYSSKDLHEYMWPRARPSWNYYVMLRFGIWWMGGMERSAYAGGPTIAGYTCRGRFAMPLYDAPPGSHSNHGSKGAAALIADILGDWREELLLTRDDDEAIRIHMSSKPTEYRFHTFMEDPVYRASVDTYNNGYNIPTTTGFYFGPDLLGKDIWFRGTYMGEKK